MAFLEFKNTVERQKGDEKPIFFSWPREGATFTYLYSLDGGSTWVAGTSTITEKTPDGNNGEYEIPYLSSERPVDIGTVIYQVTDSTDTGKINVNISRVCTSPGIETGIDYKIIVQDTGGTPLPGKTVNVSDSIGTSLGISSITNSDGEAPFKLTPDTYQFQTSSDPDYNLPDPITEEVSLTNPQGVIILTANNADILDPEQIDLSGFKRVRTKHIDIETHDPRIIQEVRDKEKSTLPLFGDCPGQVGRGKYVREYKEGY